MKYLDTILYCVLLSIISYHLVISPYTKVEESFNIQATHDVLKYGFDFEKFDHNEFPGVVPRTFIGSLFISLLAKPFTYIYDGIDLQLLVRGILGLLNFSQLVKLASINKKSKIWYLILLCSQFHILYYSTRTLPNFIALPLVNHSIAKLLKGDLSGLTWLAFTGIIFRLEVGVFATIYAVLLMLYTEPPVIIIYLIAGTIIGGLFSVVVDSFYWQKLLIPELHSFIFNIVEGKSVEWGTEPYLRYFNKYLIQLFRPPIILALCPPGLVNCSNRLRLLFISSIIYILVMSFQPHKEWRFIIYVVPIFTLTAATGLLNIAKKWNESLSNKLLLLIVLGIIGGTSVLSLFMGYVSSFNYPGGEALQFLNSYVNESANVHLDVASCMTGITRFGQSNELINYNKTESEIDYKDFDYLISSKKLEFEKLYTAKLFKQLSFRDPYIITEDYIYVYKVD
ncbi:unnamed protein product [Candida verbasci]|uniref:Mannosyltransferase n=1 Tax=Candida verbasci TaxID=1227364 RepID=A0A9W4TSM5_9ASCO|nr:unnamed protein product [Candida verbasci]